MFTQTALHACVFVLNRFFCQIQCFDWAECSLFHAWPKCDSTRTEDGDFQLHEIIFLEYRARKAAWVEHGPLSHMNYARPQGGFRNYN